MLPIRLDLSFSHRLRGLLATLPFLPALLPSASAQYAESIRAVSEGVATSVRYEPAEWTSTDGALVGSGVGIELIAGRALGAGDFAIAATLSIDEPDGTACAFVFDDENYFGFDAQGRRFYTNGPAFGGEVRLLGDARAHVKPGEVFDFQVSREGARVRFLMDGDEILAIDHAGPFGTVGFSPWRATVRVRSFVVVGTLTDLPRDMPFVDVFHSGQEGYASFRIPALCTTRAGTVLAFCEGRDQAGDHAANDIVLKRSTDGGTSFAPLQVVAADGQNSLNNPMVVQVTGGERAGRVLVMYQRYPEGIHEREVEPGYEGDKICRGFLVHSDDEGETWSAPREVTRGVKRAERVTSIAGGPGIGLELRRGPHAGRIVFPFNEGPFGDWRVYAAFSDDGGETWSHGTVAPEGSPGHGNEVQMVELLDGSLLLNSRSAGGAKLRKTAVSRDGGATWTPLVDETQLPEPQCMASILRYSGFEDGERSRILYAGPADASGRRKGLLRLSYTEGQTWTESVSIYRGAFAYSCLGVLPDRSIGCLFERDGYKRISLARVTLEQLTGPE